MSQVMLEVALECQYQTDTHFTYDQRGVEVKPRVV